MKRLSPLLLALCLFTSCQLLQKAPTTDTTDTSDHQDHGKEGPCGSQPCSEPGAGELIDLYESDMEDDLMIEKSFKIVAHIVQNPSTPSDLDKATVVAAINELNRNFAGAHISFDLQSNVSNTSSIHYLSAIRSDQQFEKTITDPLDVDNTINLYLVQTNSLLAGYTPVLAEDFKDYVNLDLNRIFISHKAIKQPATVAHEFGHFFNLQHTFGNSPLEASTTERLDGSNCQQAGDFICDTPPDPNGQQDCCDCSYLGTTQPTNVEFNPLTNNFMSYYKYCCRTAFTPGQLRAVKMAALEYRGYLN